MRSQQLQLEKYNTDRIDNLYLEKYDPVFASLVNSKVKILELGVYNGGSLLLWRDYFPLGTVVGIDIKLPRDFGSQERIHLYRGSQADRVFLSAVANEIAPEGFDIIIDDASHIGELTNISFWHLFDNHLKTGGIYAIEDWGTGYWDDWPDGMSIESERSNLSKIWSRVLSKFDMARIIPIKIPFHCHSYGMVGFVKQLLDEQGAADISRGRLKGKSKRKSKFESLLITPSIVFVRKA
jgi:hypothetical protein